MTDKNNKLDGSEEIDAFLTSSKLGKLVPRDPREFVEDMGASEAKQLQDNADHVCLLHHRVSHADSSLRQSLTNIIEMQALLDTERHDDGRLVAEFLNIEKALTQLEHRFHRLGPFAATATDGGTDVAGIDTEKARLLSSLEAQEVRIRQLESQLQQLRPAMEPDSGITRQRERSKVVTNESLETDPYANRMIVTVHDDENLKFPLSGSVTTIGREPGNDIQIRSRFVSRFHARIVSDKDGATIEDLDSRNGISVNTEKVSRRQLRSGDFIKIGRMQLQYIDIMESGYRGGRA